MAVVDVSIEDDGMWVIDVLDEIHERMLTARDFEGLRRLARLDDHELILLATAEINNWSNTT